MRKKFNRNILFERDMHLKKYFILFIVMLVNVFCYATPDRKRTITDTILGFSDKDIIIYQVISDNNGSHYNGIYERYVIIKEIKDQKLIIKEKHKIENDSEITAIINKPNFTYAIPDICESKYINIIDNNSINYLEITVYFKDIIPKELQDYKVDSIDQIYDLTDNVLVVINFINKSNTEYLKKVILLLERDK